MQLQPREMAAKEFERARVFLVGEDTVAALAHLEKALKLDDNPAWYSFFGYCIAKERGQVRKGIDLCKLSMQSEAENPVHYLNLGKIHLVSGNKPEALRVFREGIAIGQNEEIMRMLNKIGIRKPPIISFLPRGNPLNRILGFILDRFGLR